MFSRNTSLLYFCFFHSNGLAESSTCIYFKIGVFIPYVTFNQLNRCIITILSLQSCFQEIQAYCIPYVTLYITDNTSYIVLHSFHSIIDIRRSVVQSVIPDSVFHVFFNHIRLSQLHTHEQLIREMLGNNDNTTERQSNTTQLARNSHFSKKNWLPRVGLKPTTSSLLGNALTN